MATNEIENANMNTITREYQLTSPTATGVPCTPRASPFCIWFLSSAGSRHYPRNDDSRGSKLGTGPRLAFRRISVWQDWQDYWCSCNHHSRQHSKQRIPPETKKYQHLNLFYRWWGHQVMPWTWNWRQFGSSSRNDNPVVWSMIFRRIGPQLLRTHSVHQWSTGTFSTFGHQCQRQHSQHSPSSEWAITERKYFSTWELNN